MLKIHNLVKRFLNITALAYLSIHVERNSIVGLAGSSGSGKSTLLRCIQGLEKFDGGQIELKGKSGFMFQDFQLFPHMTVLENVNFALNFKQKNREYNKKNSLDLLHQLSLVGYSSKYPHQLSGGQKQRVALARTIITNPDIILCDEPTSGLDIGTMSDVICLFQKVRDMGMTILISSHDIDFLRKLTDKIFFLKNGKIVSHLYSRDIKHPKDYIKFF